MFGMNENLENYLSRSRTGILYKFQRNNIQLLLLIYDIKIDNQKLFFFLFQFLPIYSELSWTSNYFYLTTGVIEGNKSLLKRAIVDRKLSLKLSFRHAIFGLLYILLYIVQCLTKVLEHLLQIKLVIIRYIQIQNFEGNC